MGQFYHSLHKESYFPSALEHIDPVTIGIADTFHTLIVHLSPEHCTFRSTLPSRQATKMVRRSARIRANEVPVRGGWVLPHGMGIDASRTSGPSTAATAVRPATRAATHAEEGTATGQSSEEDTNLVAAEQAPVESTHQEPDNDHSGTCPHHESEVSNSVLAELNEQKIDEAEETNTNIRPIDTSAVEKENNEPVKEDTRTEIEKLSVRRSKRVRKQVTDGVNTATDQLGVEAPQKPARRSRKRVKVEDDAVSEEQAGKPKRVPKKTKDNPYGLTPGRSPFPEWEAPSAEQCEVVYRLLADMHDDVQPQSPEVIPAPSMEVTGCGEVPFVLEALIRTLLSGAVTFAGAARMLKGIIAKFGTLKDGVAEGSIDWNKVRLSPIEDLIEAIREGGLANRKAVAIKGTLDRVYQENLDRKAAYLAERETGVPATVYGAAQKTESQKDLEILKTDQNILSLDHMRGLSADDAMREFTKYPGIGVKTAACVILFCLQIPCFAVDTHVHRFSKWLGWTPPTADENNTFSHLEVRCPDHLKYGLHQLFIRHGQTCGRCKTSTAEGTKDWDAVVCPLEHLVVRGKKMAKGPKPKKEKKGVKQEEDGEEAVNQDVKEEEAEEDIKRDDLETEETVEDNKDASIDELDVSPDDSETKELESETSEVDEAIFENREFKP